MHCCFSGDSSSSPESMAEASIKKGLTGICFTDHLDYDYPKEPGLFLLDLSLYEKKIHALQKEYKGRLDILYGIELGLQPHLAQKHKDLLDRKSVV